MTQYVSVPKVLKALSTLKSLGHPYYQFVPISYDFIDDLREKDIEGFQFIFPEDEVVTEAISADTSEGEIFSKDKSSKNHILNSSDIKVCDELDEGEQEEQDYHQNDSVKKWQFEYNRSICFSHDYPEIDYREDK